MSAVKRLGALALAAALLAAGCGDSQGPEPLPPPAFLKGVSLTPRSTQPADFVDFFAKAKQAGDVVRWAGDWIALADTVRGGPEVVAGLARTYGYTPVVELQVFEPSTGQLLRPLDTATRQWYRGSAVDYARRNRPPYLGLGTEINILYEKSPADFETFVQLFAEVRGAVKAASPGTRVFTVFQLEKMRGLGGGLFGGTNDTTRTEWALLDRFPDAEVVGFTTYPGLVFKSPAEIPPRYYADIASHAAKPVAFTEIGWHSDPSPAGWESSEAEQAEFVSVFFARSARLDKKLTLWSFLYDQDAPEPFRSMGLRRPADDHARLAWNEWLRSR